MRSICICGSKRFANEIAEFSAKLESKGVLVFEPNFKEPLPEDSEFGSAHLKKTIFKGLTLEHFDWIRKADVCFVFNQDDYCGVSVSLEMGYASASGKPIFALSESTGDPCRDSLIDKSTDDIEQLIKWLS